MLFSSMTFIYVFLPIVLLIYLLSKKSLHNYILLGASIIFYAWGEPRYLAIMFLTILVNYFGAIFIDRYKDYKKTILILTILVNLGFLVYFKYFNFLIRNLNGLFHTNIVGLNIIMPIGISFYTFQALSYVIDVYRGECDVQKDIYKLSLYICLFPQLIAGPIVKYHDIAQEIDNRDVNFDKVKLGVQRFIIGLSKKVLIANTMGAVVDKIFIQDPSTLPHLVTWLGAFAYSFQLFFDFSGYSDMAIGLGLIFGFKFLENFNYPYISKSISEFWRRWHISLSTWFKQYVYISLGGNRCGMVKTLRNLGIVFLLTGIWHGAEWTFILWGCWHGLFICLEKYFNMKNWQENNSRLKWLQHIYCLFVVLIGWVVFRSENISYALKYIMNMFGILRPSDIEFAMCYYMDWVGWLMFIVAILCSMPIFNNILNPTSKLKQGFVNFYLLLIFFISTLIIASNTYNPFIYFRF